MGEVHNGLYLLQHSPSDTYAIPTQSQATPSFQYVFDSIFKSLPTSVPLSQTNPFYHDCFPDSPPLPVTDSIHHSDPIPEPSTPIDSTILEENFIDLLVCFCS